MFFDLAQIDPAIGYKLLTATIVPRPIAWVSTLDAEGRPNAAPFSFFNALGDAPPTIALGITGAGTNGLKDTAQNILDTGEFVVNLVPAALAEQMNTTSINAPRGVNELELAGLSTAPATHVKPPRIAQSPVSFECVTHTAILTGPHQLAVIGRVLAVHVADAFVLNAERGHIDTPGLNLIGRGFGATYIRTGDTFDMVRPRWQD